LLQQSKGYQSCAMDGAEPNSPAREHATIIGQRNRALLKVTAS
jgi:hypothetical protein